MLGISVEVSSAVMIVLVVIIFGVGVSGGSVSSSVEEAAVVIWKGVWGVSGMFSLGETGVLDASAEVM